MSATQRSPRARQHAGMVLMPDDRRILVALERYRYLQTRQFYRLFPSRSEQVLRRRLRLLVAHELVHRIQRHITRGPTSDNAYCLTREGLTIVADELGCPVEALVARSKAARVSEMFLAHYLMANDVRIAAEGSLAAHAHLALVEWMSEYAIARADAPVTQRTQRYLLKETIDGPDGRRYFFAPDGAFLIHRRDDPPDRSMLFCVEADRGTESLTTRIRPKVTGYELFAQREGYRRFGALGVRVLFVCESAARLENMRRVLADAAVKVFLAVDADLSPQTFFDGPVWIGQDGARHQLYRPPTE